MKLAMFKKLLKKIFDFYIIKKSDREDIYYKRVVKEPYSENLVRQRLKEFDYRKDIGPLKILKVYKHANWEDYNLLPALKYFGEVVEYPMQNINPYSLYWQVFKKREFNRRFVEAAEKLFNDGKINMIFTLASGLIFLPETFESISKLRMPVINFVFDDHLKFIGYPTPTGWSGSKDICKYITLTAVSYRGSCEKYLYEGGRPLYVPEAGNYKIHRPLNMRKNIDVCFVGRNYGRRRSVVKFLEDNGIKIQAYGIDWPNGPVSIDKMVELYSSSKIVLGINDSWGGGRFFATCRDFEATLCGSMYITARNDRIAECFEDGKEIVLYEANEDLLEKIKYYLAHEAERELIAAKGRERSLRDHTWEERLGYIFKFVGVIS